MNHPLQRAGAYAALYMSFAYIFGFILLLTVLSPPEMDASDSTQQLAFILDHQLLYQVWILCIYVLFGIALLFLTSALHDRLKERQHPYLDIAKSLGMIWAGLVIASGMIINVGLNKVGLMFQESPLEATALWETIETMHNGLGGGVEIVGGAWVWLLSLIAWKAQLLPKGLNILGFIIGISGILTVIPGLEDLGAVFGLLQIGWFIWLGILLPKSK